MKQRFNFTILMSQRMTAMLVKAGADLDWRNAQGNTALHYCFAFRHLDLAEYLIRKGADDTIMNKEGHMCYDL